MPKKASRCCVGYDTSGTGVADQQIKHESRLQRGSHPSKSAKSLPLSEVEGVGQRRLGDAREGRFVRLMMKSYNAGAEAHKDSMREMKQLGVIPAGN